MIAFTVCESTTDLKTLDQMQKHSLLMYTYSYKSLRTNENIQHLTLLENGLVHFLVHNDTFVY